MATLTYAALLLTTATCAYAQYGGFGNGNNPFHGGGNDGGSSNGFSGIYNFDGTAFFQGLHTTVLAHAILACVAFVFFFPVGGIMIRLASFRGLWLVHGLFQVFGYLLYIAAFALGIYMAANIRNIFMEPHAIIGIVLFILLFFQPLSGYIHHVAFLRVGARTSSSHWHVWLGRIVITAGIVNGGLGLELASRLPFARPSRTAVIAYIAVAAIMWLLYVAAAVVGELRRRRNVPAGSVVSGTSYTSSQVTSHASSREPKSARASSRQV